MKNRNVDYFKLKTWYNIRSRTLNNDGSNKKNRCYTGIKLMMTRPEYYKWCEKQKTLIESFYKKGLVPSIDRINPKKNYTISNLRIVELKVNLSRASTPENKLKRETALRKKLNRKTVAKVGNKKYSFESRKAAAKYFDLNESSIRSIINTGKATRDGVKFYG